MTRNESAGTKRSLITDFHVATLQDFVYVTDMKFETPTLEQFIAKRRQELDAMEATLRKELALVTEEQSKLKRVALAAGIPEMPAPIQQEASIEQVKRHPKRASGKTIKEAIVQVLKDAGHGLSAAQILPMVNESLGLNYPRSSLSPQLSRLKHEGILELDGRVWNLPSKEKAPDGDAGEQSSGALFDNPSMRPVKPEPGGAK